MSEYTNFIAGAMIFGACGLGYYVCERIREKAQSAKGMKKFPTNTTFEEACERDALTSRESRFRYKDADGD